MNKNIVAGLFGAAIILAAGPAWADRGRDRDHDDRTVVVRVNDNDRARYDRNDRYDRYDRDQDRYRTNNGYRSNTNRAVSRKVINTRYRATIIVTERMMRGRYDRDRVCVVDARGPEARRISSRQLRSAARQHCSRRADIRITR
ncbi:MAG: hypothetical protein R3C40_07505 [Parvularculaceae bacterium]